MYFAKLRKCFFHLRATWRNAACRQWITGFLQTTWDKERKAFTERRRSKMHTGGCQAGTVINVIRLTGRHDRRCVVQGALNNAVHPHLALDGIQ